MSENHEDGKASPSLLDGLSGLLKVPEACQVLRLSHAKVYQLMDAGELAYARFGRSRRISRRALAEYVARCTVCVVGAVRECELPSHRLPR
jgi:excisionase family DNA binding protein